MREFDGRIDTSLSGPANPFKKDGEAVAIPLRALVDHEVGAAAIEIAGRTVVVPKGAWSDWVQVQFDLLPLGLSSVYGIVRFHVKSLTPFELYASGDRSFKRMTPGYEGSGSERIRTPLEASEACVWAPRTSVLLLSAASGSTSRRFDASVSGPRAWRRPGRVPLGCAQLTPVATYQANSGSGGALAGAIGGGELGSSRWP